MSVYKYHIIIICIGQQAGVYISMGINKFIIDVENIVINLLSNDNT